MIRVLLVILAVLVAILALLLDKSWLYVAAAAPLGVALVLLVRRLWRASKGGHGESGRESNRPTTRESLADLGIMEVRPQQRGQSPKRTGASTQKTAPSHDDDPTPNRPVPSSRPSSEASSTDASAPASHTTGPRSSETASSSTATTQAPSDADAPEDASGADTTSTSTPTSTPRPALGPEANGTWTDVEESPVLAPYVASLRAALNAHTVCLLVQEEVALEYRILAIASATSDAHRSGRFETREPLLTATMTQEPVTIREIQGDRAVADFLGYYQTPVPIDHVALAPVSRPNDPATFFLLADATRETDLGTSQARAILERFADTLGLLLHTDHGVGSDELSVDVMIANDQTTTASEAAAAEAAQAAEFEASTPRPRSEIVAEEMHDADVERHELSLVLVHLNRAESIAKRGTEAVESAERLLRIRLEDAAPGSRVTRFGELTYGVFFRGGADQVEPWAVDLQDELAEESGELQGGVSIGVAVRGPRHDQADALRADATRALREAYETGTCTIIE